MAALDGLSGIKDYADIIKGSNIGFDPDSSVAIFLEMWGDFLLVGVGGVVVAFVVLFFLFFKASGEEV